MKYNIFIWGAGYLADYVYNVINKQNCFILGMVDCDKEKQGKTWNKTLKIYSPQVLNSMEYDYIVVSIENYKAVEEQCEKLNVPLEKVVCYWKDLIAQDLFENRATQLVKEIKKRLWYEQRLESAPYEWGLKSVPNIVSAEILLKKIRNDKSSLSRFGDGEFNIMSGRGCPWFQEETEGLKKRLMEVIASDCPNLNIAIAQNFIHLEQFKETAADEIRAYMSCGTREAILSFLDMERVYYDAYVSRPYILYKDKTNAERIFPLFKEIWKNRHIVIVEGEFARSGINNDLYKETESIKRVICPYKDVWNYYEKVKETVLNVSKIDDLICISLGPTATVLAYDLAREGRQSIDIGQLDNEYDWYLNGATQRTKIPGKMVAEIKKNRDIEIMEDRNYYSQIAARVGC